jgi:rhodanese-related sulfurtransferase
MHAAIPIENRQFMTIPSVTPSQVRIALLLRDEIALLDVRHEAAFATGHPLFAANMAADRMALEAEVRLPRKDVPIVLYDAGEGLVSVTAERLAALSAATSASSTAGCRLRPRA